MFRRDAADNGVDYQRIRVCDVYLAGIPEENRARHESCVTSLPEINGDLKRRIETVARARERKLPRYSLRWSYRYSNYSQRENSEELGARNYTGGRAPPY